MNKEKYLDNVLNFLCSEANIEYNCNTFDEKVNLWKKLVIERDIKDIPNNILDDEDKFLRLQLFNRKLKNGEELKSVNELLGSTFKNGDKICILEHDVTSIYCDALVNLTTIDALGEKKFSDSLNNKIMYSSGMRLRNKCNVIMNGSKLRDNEVIITRAYNLPCDFIIHVYEAKNNIKEFITNILECSKNNLVKTLVIPVDGNNIDIILNTINDYLDINGKYFNKIILITGSDEVFDKYEEYIEQKK